MDYGKMKEVAKLMMPELYRLREMSVDEEAAG